MVLLVAALHTAVLPHFRLFDVSGDVLLLVAIAGGLVSGPKRGAWVGFFAGLLADCFVRTPFGLSALTYCLVGYGVGSLKAGVLQMSWWLPGFIIFVASAVGVVAFVGMGTIMGQEHLWSWRLPTIAGVVALLNVAISPLVLRGMRWTISTSESRVAR